MALARVNNKYDTYLLLLIGSLVFGGLGGVLMVPRVLALLLLPVLLKKYKSCKDYLHRYTNFFVFFYVYCLISLIWTPDITQGLKELLYYPLHFLMFVEILVFSRFSRNPLNTICTSWVICVSFTLLIAIWELATGNHLFLSLIESDDALLHTGGGLLQRPFASVTFGNFNGYVTFLCFALPFLFYFFLSNLQNLKSLIISIVILTVSITVILINASRGGILSILLMIVILLMMTPRSMIKSIFIVFSGLLLFYYIIPLWDTIFLTLSVRSENTSLLVDEGRFDIWYKGLIILKDYLFIGTGIGGIVAALTQMKASIPITHNMMLEILVQFGVLIFLAFIGFILRIYNKARRTNDRNRKIMLYMALFAFPIYSIIDSTYLLSPVVYISFACYTVFAYFDKIHP